MLRSIRVRPDLISRVELALKHNGFLRQKDLVAAVGFAESTVRNFLKGKPVDYATFVEICQRLNLEWQDFADLGEITEPHRKSKEAVITRYSTSETEKTISDTLDLAEREEAIANPHQETEELIETSASDLNSKRYSELERLLTAKQWQEANEETRTIMLNIASREIEGSLRAPDINKFPCQDLHTIDKLWVEYSNRHFGFSVQKRIWKDVVKSRSNPNYRTLCRFGERVGWHMNGSWLSCPDLSFAENSAPVGHLPATFFIIYGNLLLNSSAYLESRFETQAEHGSRLSASFFFSRVETCKL